MQDLPESERQRREAVLKAILAELEKPVPEPYPQSEDERQRAAKEDARKCGRELLTTKSAARLFDKSPVTVRRAVSEGHIRIIIELSYTDKKIRLFPLRAAVSYWGSSDDDLLNKMRSNGHVLGYNGALYNVLSETPLVTLCNPEELEGRDD